MSLVKGYMVYVKNYKALLVKTDARLAHAYGPMP